MNALLAVPSMAPGGLDAAVSAHFGRCGAFTLIALRNGRIEKTMVMQAPDHGEGGCMVPVNLLAAHGVTGHRRRGHGAAAAARRCCRSEFEPYFAGDLATVKNVVSAFVAGGLRPFGRNSCCGSNDHHAGSCGESGLSADG